MNYWELRLRASASSLPSLQYFKPEFMSLARPHPIFTSAGSSPYSVAMAKVQSIMLSGRYRTEALSSHWSETRSPHCKTPHCKDLGIREELLHILATCKSLEPTRERLKDFTRKYCSRLDSSEVQRIIHTYSSPTHPQFCQFLTDCSEFCTPWCNCRHTSPWSRRCSSPSLQCYAYVVLLPAPRQT